MAEMLKPKPPQPQIPAPRKNDFDEDILDYLTFFETNMESREVEKKHWSFILHPLLSKKYYSAVARKSR